MIVRAWPLVGLLLMGCARPEAEDLPRPTPGLELRAEDYAKARAGFATRLVREGPTPSQGEALGPIADATVIDYRSGDLLLRAYRSHPSTSGIRKRAVLLLHGGYAFGAGQWEMRRPFREAGFVVMMPVLRGENGLPGSFSLFHNEVDDVLAAAEVLAGQSDVDSRNLFLAGHSVGGTLTMLAALTSTRFRAAASMSGSPDLSAYLQASRATPPFDPSHEGELRIRSAVAYANSFKCPTRFFVGDEEFWLQGSTLRTALLAKRAGLDVEAVEMPGDHFSSMPEAIRRSLEFFRRQAVSD